MPGALVDLFVAGRLGARAIGRRLTGRLPAAPNVAGFRTGFERALAALPPGCAAEHRWITLPAREPPWRDTEIALRTGDEISWFAVGRVYASRAFDIWVAPKNQLWTRVGADGAIRSATRDSHTLRADRDGQVYLGNYFPNDWKDATGARLQDDAVYAGVSGETTVLLIRWARGAREGLEALARAGDPEGRVAGELERLTCGNGAPAGWHYLWHLGEAEIYKPSRTPEGRDAICCEVEGDLGILQKQADFTLADDTTLSWRWKLDALPGLMREDSVPTHDYLSIAVEFENGWDLTYYWSRSLAPGTGYVCPLPNWKHREYHVVVRSGREGLGEWHTEERRLRDDYARYLGAPPSRVVRVWLIANSIFQRQLGRAAFSEIRVRGGGRELTVL